MFWYRPFLAVCLLAYVPLSLCAHVFFEITLTWEIKAPDGQPRYVVLSNGLFPGPQLNLDYGDEVEVSRQLYASVDRADYYQFVVHNNLPFDSTVHFHGIEYVGKTIAKQDMDRNAEQITGRQVLHGQTEHRAFLRSRSPKVEVSLIIGRLLSTVLTGMTVA